MKGAILKILQRELAIKKNKLRLILDHNPPDFPPDVDSIKSINRLNDTIDHLKKCITWLHGYK